MTKGKAKGVDTPNIDLLDFEGTPVQIGKKVLIIPPLPITVLHKSGFYKLQGELIAAQEDNDLETISDLTLKVLEYVFKAIQMNYPDAKKEDTIELITTRKLREVVPALIDIQEGWDKAKNA